MSDKMDGIEFLRNLTNSNYGNEEEFCERGRCYLDQMTDENDIVIDPAEQ